MNVWAGATGRDFRSNIARGGLSVLGLLALGVLPSCESGSGGFVGEEASPDAGKTCWQCTPDVEPSPVDCAKAEEGVEFLPVTIYDFDNGSGSNMYTYTDNTAEFFDISASWQPAATETVRCLDKPNERALHLRGGPFVNWGGGVGRHFKCLNSNRTEGPGRVKVGPGPERWGTTARDENNQPIVDEDGNPVIIPRETIGLGCDFSDPVQACETVRENPEDEATDPESVLARSVCPQRDIDFVHSGRDLDNLASPEEEFLLNMTLDLSDWDGISFWARRGPDSIAGFKIGIGDKHTDDDLSFLQYHINPDSKRFCERNFECGCPGGGECTFKSTEDGGDDHYRCWDAPRRPTKEGVEQYLLCGQEKCQQNFAPGPSTDDTVTTNFAQEFGIGVYDAFGFDGISYPDSLTDDTSCQTFAFRGGNQDAFCMSDDKVPYERPFQCGDHWVKAVYLSTEWQFYKVPFTELLQEGWAQESHHLDLTTAAVTRFTWSTGWIDFWIDDVRIYRNTHNTADE